jgi:hypothetical protein
LKGTLRVVRGVGEGKRRMTRKGKGNKEGNSIYNKRAHISQSV